MARLLPVVLPFASAWVAWHERSILRRGGPLSDQEISDAVRMGVRHPEKIRLLEVTQIPVLNGLLVRILARWIPSVSPHTVGLSLRYGIYVRSHHWRDRHLIAHECVHTAQYERLGSIHAFLSAYFSECVTIGYPAAPLEQEAVMLSSGLPDGNTAPNGSVGG